MPASATAQVNARLDPQLKSEGDKALAAAGFTPTQAVRALWSLARRYASEPAKLASVLNPDMARKARAGQEEHRTAIEQSIRDGSLLVSESLAQIGVTHPAEVDLRSYDQLKLDAYTDRFGEEMGWNE